eukprot:CAMPEP_0182948130 /NCGR_PEP_ID=MMETSP0105_2-20130417/59601_1 /TAXON_ID=81532 ORGANISM="Acanthoeca-like sp., Strain 10tr" /NCGR_SAMPLE_ID=MMETSP0105_2 /ASSEMBLY_ACC=CAM_ASM_000205 /LENGTH=315 /DNA_ID=CAMNT_0025088417 /DNA_START=91 /DNA_END=1039 /DNA_ORIENTATION=-
MRAHTVLAGRSAPLLRRAVPLSQEEARRANDAKKEGHDLEAKGSAARNVYAIDFNPQSASLLNAPPSVESPFISDAVIENETRLQKAFKAEPAMPAAGTTNPPRATAAPMVARTVKACVALHLSARALQQSESLSPQLPSAVSSLQWILGLRVIFFVGAGSGPLEPDADSTSTDPASKRMLDVVELAARAKTSSSAAIPAPSSLNGACEKCGTAHGTCESLAPARSSPPPCQHPHKPSHHVLALKEARSKRMLDVVELAAEGKDKQQRRNPRSEFLEWRKPSHHVLALKEARAIHQQNGGGRGTSRLASTAVWMA